MFLQNNLINIPGSRQKRQRVGRGNGSNRGTYSGLGNKGQHSRGSAKIHQTFTGQGGRSRFILGIPKKRGFKSMRIKPTTVTLNLLNLKFQEGDLINSKSLFEKKILDTLSEPFKIVGNTKLSFKLSFDENVKFSKKARELIS